MARQHSRIKQKRSLGQVFLKQTWPVDRMVERLKELKVERVLEIGPGAGVLTKAMLKQGLHVVSVERDDRFVELLRDLEAEYAGKFQVVPEDILKFDLPSWLGEQKSRTAVVGNIPYNISSPILQWGLPHIDQLASFMVMTQLEFAQRVIAASGNKSYGSLSVYVQLRCQARLLFKVDRTCFKPVPKVDSAVIEMVERHGRVDQDTLDKAEKLTRRAFMQRRKVMRNGISQWVQGRDLVDCPIDLTRRPETLTPNEFVALSQYLFPAED